MKKFYLLLVVLCAALSMNAAVETLYMIDDFTNPNWNVETGVEMTKVSDGVFTTGVIEVTEKTHYFGFTSVVGNWSAINNSNTRLGPSVNNTKASYGKFSAEITNNNSWTIDPGKYIFKVDAENKVLAIFDENGNIPREDKWRVWSNLAGGTDWSGNDMSFDGTAWTVEIDVKQTGSKAQFGLEYFAKKDVDSKAWWAAKSGSATVTLNQPMSIASSDNTNFIFGDLETGKYLFSLNEDTKQLTIAEVSEGEDTNVRYAVRTNIFTKSDEFETIELSLVDERWQCTDEVLSNGKIYVVGYDKDGNETVYGAPTSGVTTNINCPLNLSVGNTPYEFNRYIEVDENNALSKFRDFRLIFDPAAKTIMLLRVGAPIYMLGSVDQSSWNTSNTNHPMTNVAGTNIYYSDFIKFNGNPVDDGFSYFLFTSTPSAEGQTEDWNTANIGRYSPGVNDIDLTNRSFYQIVKNTNEKSFKVPQGTVMRVVINLDTRYNEFYRAEDFIPNTLYLHGNLWGHHFDWSGSDSAPRVDNGDGTATYTFETMLIEDHGDGNGYYVISNWRKEGGVQAAPAREASRAIGTSPDENLVSELVANGHVYKEAGPVSLKNTYSALNDGLVTVKPNTFHTITVTMYTENGEDEDGNLFFAGDIKNVEDKDVTSDMTTGIEAVDVEDVNAPVEYYNMQGVRVVNPENGVYIRRQGKRVTKVVL